MTIIDEIGPPRLGPGFGLETSREVEAVEGGTIRVEDPGLLFHGHYARTGADLVISDEGHRLVVHEYFGVLKRPKLVAPDGASLSDAAIEDLSGARAIYAQAGANPVSDASAVIGRVQKVGGGASLVRNGVTVAVQAGDLVHKGDVVQTDRAGSLAIAFLDGTLFTLSASARMVLNEMVFKAEGNGGTALFNLIQGSITFVAGQVAKTGDMKVATPVATMGIRGTAVHVQIDADNGTTRFSVMTEPDGHTGRFDVYDRDDAGRLLFTVSDSTQAFVVRPSGAQQVAFEAVPKTLLEIRVETGLVQTLFQTLSEVPRLPVPQGPGGSSTPPDLLPPDVSPQQGLGPNGAGGPLPGTGDAPALPGKGPPPAGPEGVVPRLSDEPPVAPRPADPSPPNLVLLPQTVTVQQDAALRATSAGQGVLVAAPGSTAINVRIVAAHAGADAGAEGQPLTDGAIVLAGRYGTLQLNADGTYLYRADRAAALAEGVHGTDAFSYRVEGEGGAAAVATLTVDIAGVNDAPAAAGTVDLGAMPARAVRTVTQAELLAGASDVDGDALAVTGLAIRSGGGAIVDLGPGRFAYEPGPVASGPVILAYTVTDGHGGSLARTASLTLRPNSPAAITGDLTGRVQEDGQGFAAGTLTVVDADPGEAHFAVPATLAGRYGSFRFDTATGQWAYALANQDPAIQALGAGERLQDRLSLTALDGSAAQDIVVTIAGSNDVPILGASPQASLTELAGRTGSSEPDRLSGSLAFADADRHDGHGVTVGAPVVSRSGAALPPELSAALTGALMASVTEDSGTGRIAYAFAVADAALDGLRGGERLDVTYTLTLSDGQGGLATQPVGITLIGTNDAPVAQDAEASLRAGRTLSGTLVATDPDSEGLTFAAVAGPAHGRLSLGPDGTYTYTPDAGFRGTDRFTYRASDGSLDSNLASVTVAVHGGAAPVITSGAHSDLSLTAGASGKVLTPLAARYLTTGNSLVDGLGGTAGFGETLLGPNDDASTGAIDIRDVFGAQGLNLFGHDYTAIYVNNNGNITFDGPLGEFRPSRIGAGSQNPIIAPFWADVDTSTGAQNAPTPGGRSTGSNRVHIDKDAENGVLTVTWDDVGYFSNHTDKLNAFQLQLIDLQDGNFDIVYRYEAVNWTLGDYSEGLHARAGYSAGDGSHSFELPQSGNAAAMRALPTIPGNTGTPGLFVFEVRNGSVDPGATLTRSGTIGFSDADPGDRHTVEATLEAGSLHWRRPDGSDAGAVPGDLAAHLTHAFTAQVTAESAAERDAAGSATWTLAVPESEFAFLRAGDTLSLVYDVVIRDETAQSVPATVAVTVTGANHPPAPGGVSVTQALLSAAEPAGRAAVPDQSADALNPASDARIVAQAISAAGPTEFVTVTGTAGDDVLGPGTGEAAILTGAGGHDVFVFAATGPGQPVHRVTDFDAAADAIDLAEFTLAASERIEDVLHLSRDEAGGYDLSVRGANLVHLDLAEGGHGAGEAQDALTVIWSNHLAHLAIPSPV
ncbi:VCBS domain-containing protein [Methylobacterium soli]|uniref:Tandem-95 repeat protein n=1 Tax=Methylobacterium soli TaxID=553447 RepID=A0A6L3STD6_9HYPH|nr:VCBS domain-containing protein [Methylobacterium soli]KAB1072079.1 tandem-95 repeat protein [Methylobacterium soli]